MVVVSLRALQTHGLVPGLTVPVCGRGCCHPHPMRVRPHSRMRALQAWRAGAADASDTRRHPVGGSSGVCSEGTEQSICVCVESALLVYVGKHLCFSSVTLKYWRDHNCHKLRACHLAATDAA